MNKEQIQTKLFTTFSNFLQERNIEMPKDFTINDNILEIEDLDSLDLVELFVYFEDELDVQFPDKFQDFETMKSLSKLSEYIHDELLVGNSQK